MSYATQDQIPLQPEFFTGDLSPSSQQVQDALDMASAFMDGFISANPDITLPLSPPYDMTLVMQCGIIAAWYLVAARGYDPDSSDETIHARYKDAVSWLQKLQEARVVLTGQTNTRPQAAGLQPTIMSNPTRGLRNWGGIVGGSGN